MFKEAGTQDMFGKLASIGRQQALHCTNSVCWLDHLCNVLKASIAPAAAA